MLIDDKRGLMVWTDGVDETMHTFVIEALTKLNANKRKTITFVLSTHGGSTHVGLALYDLIKTNPKPVRIVVSGQCASAGTLILQAGSERLAFEHSHLHIHYGSNSADSHAEAEFDRRFHAKWVELMAAATKGKTKHHDMDQMHKNETYLTAQDALLHGLIDGITKEIQ